MKLPWVTPACSFQVLRITPHSPNQVLHLKKVSVTHTLLSGGFLTLAETSSICVYVRVGACSSSHWKPELCSELWPPSVTLRRACAHGAHSETQTLGEPWPVVRCQQRARDSDLGALDTLGNQTRDCRMRVFLFTPFSCYVARVWLIPPEPSALCLFPAVLFHSLTLTLQPPSSKAGP